MGFKLEFHAQRDGSIVCARYDDKTGSYNDQFTYQKGCSTFNDPRWRSRFPEDVQLKMTRAIALSLVLQKEGHN